MTGKREFGFLEFSGYNEDTAMTIVTLINTLTVKPGRIDAFI